jgi:hypothetical protein
VSSAIGYVEEDNFKVPPTPTRISLRNESKAHKRSFDQANLEDSEEPHSEQCEVCSKSGDLIYCETCSLAFHQNCARPKLDVAPSGSWHCAYCILDGSSLAGDKDKAKLALKKMTNLALGYPSDDEQQEGSSYRLSKMGEISIIQTGKKFLVRKKGKKQTIELGR